MIQEQVYDVIIIGGGPAGLTAGIYAGRSRLNALLLEKGIVGGQIVNSDLVENFPGFSQGISGVDLMRRLEEQAVKFGLKFSSDEITSLVLSGGNKELTGAEGKYRARAVIIANGSTRLKLGVPGEEKYTGRGVSFCATCDAAFFRDQRVAVVGGGNAALSEALQLTKFASRVTIIHRSTALRATKVIQERVNADPKIDYLFDSEVAEMAGDDFMSRIRVRNNKTGREEWLEAGGIFIAIGFRPNTEYLKGLVALDDLASVMVNDRLETNVPGIFAAGDIRHASGRQCVTAAGDGALAAMNAERYLGGHV